LTPHLQLNLLVDLRVLLSFPFMVSAAEAGTVVAVLAGVLGWWVVLRRQSFLAHTLATVSFPGAAFAVLLGVAAAWGALVATVIAALVLASLPVALVGKGPGTSGAAIGTVQALALALGLAATTWYHGYAESATALLFGSFLGITSTEVVLLALIAAGAVLAITLIARPLLLTSVDPVVAAARAVPVRALSTIFVVLLGVAVAEVSQITGALLVFALLVMPAASAQALTASPARGLLLSVVLGIGIMWTSLFAGFYAPGIPIGFWVTSIGFALYLSTQLFAARRSLAAR